MSDREQILGLLAQHRDRLTARREIVAANYEQAVAREAKLAANAARRRAEYQATLRGIAESIRQIESATISGQPRSVLRKLRRQHLEAEEVSAVEYRARRDRWGHAPGDGPVRGCPVGDHPGLQAKILADRVLGSYRLDPTAATVRVRLLRDTDQGRLKTDVTVPSTVPLTVSDVVAFAFTEPRTRARLLERLQLDDQWVPLSAEAAAAATVDVAR